MNLKQVKCTTYSPNRAKFQHETTAHKAIWHSARMATSRLLTRIYFDAPHGSKLHLTDLAKKCYALKHSSRFSKLDHSICLRLNQRLKNICDEQIRTRHLSHPAGWFDFPKKVKEYRPKQRLWLIHGGGYYEYSSRAGTWWQEACYLVGHEDGQHWACRVPATCKTINEAIKFLEPATIRDARRKGYPTKRQGDIYFRPVRGLRQHDIGMPPASKGLARYVLGTRHEARPRKDGGLTIVHPQHKPLILSGKYKWRAYQQNGNFAD